MKTKYCTLVAAAWLLTICQTGFGQIYSSSELPSLTQRVDNLEAKDSQPLVIVRRETGGAALVLFGAFCAYGPKTQIATPGFGFLWAYFSMSLP